jgi:hypothetical protein
VWIRNRKVVGKWKDIKNYFYANDTLKDDLESKILKDSRRCSKELDVYSHEALLERMVASWILKTSKNESYSNISSYLVLL